MQLGVRPVPNRYWRRELPTTLSPTISDTKSSRYPIRDYAYTNEDLSDVVCACVIYERLTLRGDGNGNTPRAQLQGVCITLLNTL